MIEGKSGLGGPCAHCGTNVIDDFRRVKSDFVCPHCNKPSRFKTIRKYLFMNGSWSLDTRPEQPISLPPMTYTPNYQSHYRGSSLIVGHERDDYEHIRHAAPPPAQHVSESGQRAMDLVRAARSVSDLFQAYDFQVLSALNLWDTFRQDWANATVSVLSLASGEEEGVFFRESARLLGAGYGEAHWQRLIVHALPQLNRMPPSLGEPLLKLHRQVLGSAADKSGEEYVKTIEELLLRVPVEKRLLMQNVDATLTDGLLMPSAAIACVERFEPEVPIARTWIRASYSNRDWNYERNLPKVKAIGITEEDICRQFIFAALDAEEKFQRIQSYLRVWKYIPEPLVGFLADCIHLDRWSEGGQVAARCYSTLDLLAEYNTRSQSPLLAEAMFRATAFHFQDGSEPRKPVLEHALKVLSGKYAEYLPPLVERAINATLQSTEEVSARLTALSFPLALIAAGVISDTVSRLLEALANDRDPEVRFAVLSISDELSLTVDTVARAVASALTSSELDMLNACRRFLRARPDFAACSIRHVVDLTNHAIEEFRAVGYDLLGDIGGEEATDQLRAKLANWAEGPAVASALLRTSWTPKLPEDRIHVAMARRDGSGLRADPQAIEVISSDLRAKDRTVVNNAVFTCIGLGNEHYLARIVAVLHRSESKTMAESFINCGYEPLAAEGEKWAITRGYTILKSGDGAHPVHWNSF